MFLLYFPYFKNKIKSKWRLQTKIVPRRDGFSKTRKPLFFHNICFNSQVVSVSGSGEGPQIGDSAGDLTQNLWFHKRIKLELELGILEHMVH